MGAHVNAPLQVRIVGHGEEAGNHPIRSTETQTKEGDSYVID